ncbi:MAG: hypothetical protein ACK4WC_08635 [Rubrimonas sp.]
MSENKNSTLVLGGALVVGVVIGAAIASRNDDAMQALSTRIAAAESGVAEQFEALKASLDDSAAGEALAALDAKAAELAAQVAALTEGAGEPDAALSALEARVNTLAGQMAALVARMNEIGTASPSPAAPQTAAPAAAPEAPAAPAADDRAERLQASLGEGGVALSVGQTASIDGAAVFLSRIDDATGAVRVQIVGRGPAMIGGGADPVSLPGGCTLTLLGVADGRAFLQPECAN